MEINVLVLGVGGNVSQGIMTALRLSGYHRMQTAPSLYHGMSTCA